MKNRSNGKMNIRPWMKEDEIKFRQEAIANLILAAKNGLLPEKEIDFDNLKLFPKGARSVVFCANYQKETPYIVKMGRVKEIVEAEPYFLEIWEKQGIRTPKILSRHISNEKTPVSFSVMEYIDAPILGEVMNTEKRIRSGISKITGEILAKMHQKTGSGFGHAVIGGEIHGKFATFRDEINDNLFGEEEKVPVMIKEGILDEGIRKILDRAVDFLDTETRNEKAPSFTHNDYRPYNMFYKNGGIIVFDPNPKITHSMMCLASTIIKSRIETESEEWGLKEEKEIIKGYDSISPIRKPSLDAALMVRSIMTLHIWWKKDEKEKVRKLLKMIEIYKNNFALKRKIN